MKIDIQGLNNLDFYKPHSFSFPVVVIDYLKRKEYPWLAFIFIFGNRSYGIRFYWNNIK
jgi:hypothetical protein